jgi:hypothetical protein
MKPLFSRTFWLLTGITGLIAAGCSRTPTPPTPLPADQIAPELQKAFARAQPPAKDLVEEIVAAVQTNGYAAAFQAVQVLGTVPNTTKEQRFLTTRAMLALESLLQSAQAQGDQNAAQAIKLYQKNK